MIRSEETGSLTCFCPQAPAACACQVAQLFTLLSSSALPPTPFPVLPLYLHSSLFLPSMSTETATNGSSANGVPTLTSVGRVVSSRSLPSPSPIHRAAPTPSRASSATDSTGSSLFLSPSPALLRCFFFLRVVDGSLSGRCRHLTRDLGLSHLAPPPQHFGVAHLPSRCPFCSTPSCQLIGQHPCRRESPFPPL